MARARPALKAALWRSAAYGVAALATAWVLLGPPRSYGSLGLSESMPAIPLAGLAGFASSLALTRWRSAWRAARLVPRAVIDGLATVVLAHLLLVLGLAVVATLEGAQDLSALPVEVVVGFVVSLAAVGGVTIPVGLSIGILVEAIARTQ